MDWPKAIKQRVRSGPGEHGELMAVGLWSKYLTLVKK
jgi:hypothetical protein